MTKNDERVAVARDLAKTRPVRVEELADVLGTPYYTTMSVAKQAARGKPTLGLSFDKIWYRASQRWDGPFLATKAWFEEEARKDAAKLKLPEGEPTPGPGWAPPIIDQRTVS